MKITDILTEDMVVPALTGRNKGDVIEELARVVSSHHPEIDTTSRTTLIVSGCVVQPPVFSEGREQFVLELEPGARARVNLTLREGEVPPLLRYGQKVEFNAKLRKTRNFGNPGAFDYARYLARQDIYWTASARGAEVKILPGRCGSAFQGAIMNLRAAAMDRLSQLYHGDPYNTGMMQAILIGETAKLDKVWTEEYRSTGTFHALVISGAPVTVLASWLYARVTGGRRRWCDRLPRRSPSADEKPGSCLESCRSGRASWRVTRPG